MTNKNYRSGYNFECRVRKDLIKKGYVVFRQGSSRFPDLLCFSKDGSLMVECKYGQHPTLNKEEKRRFAELKTKTNAKLMLAKGKPRKPIEYIEI